MNYSLACWISFGIVAVLFVVLRFKTSANIKLSNRFVSANVYVEGKKEDSAFFKYLALEEQTKALEEKYSRKCSYSPLGRSDGLTTIVLFIYVISSATLLTFGARSYDGNLLIPGVVSVCAFFVLILIINLMPISKKAEMYYIEDDEFEEYKLKRQTKSETEDPEHYVKWEIERATNVYVRRMNAFRRAMELQEAGDNLLRLIFALFNPLFIFGIISLF